MMNIKPSKLKNPGGWMDFALFMAIKEVHGMASWREWKWPLKVRDKDTLKEAKDYLKDNIKTP